MLDRKPTEDLKVENIGDKTNKQKKLRGMNSGLYFFENNQHLCLFLKPRKKEKNPKRLVANTRI